MRRSLKFVFIQLSDVNTVGGPPQRCYREVSAEIMNVRSLTYFSAFVKQSVHFFSEKKRHKTDIKKKKK